MADNDDTIGRFQSTQPVTLANAQLDEPKAYTDRRTKKTSGEARYSSRLIVEPTGDDLATMKKVAAEAARAKWPGRNFAELAWPFRKGEDLIEKATKELARDNKKYDGGLDYLKGKIVVTTRSKFPPKMAAMINNKIADIDEANAPLIKKTFFTGAEAHVVLKANAYDEVADGKAGVNFYLNEIFATGGGKRLTTQRSAAATFAGYAGKHSAEDPTKGSTGDDEIPF